MATIQGPIVVRVNTVTTYIAIPTGCVQYTWTLSGGGQILNGQGSDCINIQWNAPGQWSLQVSMQLPNGQTDLAVIVITADDDEVV